ncbi:THAP domain-containing protein 3 isoform X2 [Harpegnathos saltator]|uniref:THAP domain-containing protein 3 isoform X2 n=1 Tax=Harpegnathos saltator TaxID=610380 RepID=UPI000DBEDF45|nr:THAP domain-containing protein 3 isoform X2 [Harpegnathos saltator]
MPKCIAKNCKSASTKKIKMCSFPQEREMQMLWIRNIGRSNWQPKKDSRLCEFHFADDQWETMRVDGRKKLKWKAIPTLFGEDTQIRIDIIKKKCQQELSIKEKNLSTSVNQGNTNTNEMLESPIDTTKISEQNNSMEQEDENIQTEIETEIESTQPLTLSNSKTIPEFEKKLEKLEKHLFQSKKSKKEMMKQLWDMKIKLKRLQQEEIKWSNLQENISDSYKYCRRRFKIRYDSKRRKKNFFIILYDVFLTFPMSTRCH